MSSAISSLMVRAPSESCATITVGVAHISVTGAKSFTGSNGVFGLSVGLITKLGATESTV